MNAHSYRSGHSSRNAHSYRLGLVLGCLALLMLACQASATEGGRKAAPRIGAEAPDFTLQTTRGKTITLSQYRGQPVLLNLFATWCGPCRSEMPAMQAVYKKYRPDGLAFVAVDLGDSTSEVKAFGEELGLTFPLLLDVDDQVAQMYRANSIPRSYFIDANGVIRKMGIGSMEQAQIEEAVEAIMAIPYEPTAEPAAPEKAREDNPNARMGVSSGPAVEGCVNIGSALARTGPGKEFPEAGRWERGACFRLDAQNAGGTWLRMADKTGPAGQRLWMKAEFLTISGDPADLPVE